MHAQNAARKRKKAGTSMGTVAGGAKSRESRKDGGRAERFQSTMYPGKKTPDHVSENKTAAKNFLG